MAYALSLKLLAYVLKLPVSIYVWHTLTSLCDEHHNEHVPDVCMISLLQCCNILFRLVVLLSI